MKIFLKSKRKRRHFFGDMGTFPYFKNDEDSSYRIVINTVISEQTIKRMCVNYG